MIFCLQNTIINFKTLGVEKVSLVNVSKETFSFLIVSNIPKH